MKHGPGIAGPTLGCLVLQVAPAPEPSPPAAGRGFCAPTRGDESLRGAAQRGLRDRGEINTLTSHCHQPKDKGCRHYSA